MRRYHNRYKNCRVLGHPHSDSRPTITLIAMPHVQRLLQRFSNRLDQQNSFKCPSTLFLFILQTRLISLSVTAIWRQANVPRKINSSRTSRSTRQSRPPIKCTSGPVNRPPNNVDAHDDINIIIFFFFLILIYSSVRPAVARHPIRSCCSFKSSHCYR
jgi:hypothetical protein